MPLCRLIYQSRTSWDQLTNEGLRELALRSADANATRAITGLLVLSGERFLQVLEGPSESVNQLYTKILRDRRHREVTLISYEQVASRCFEDWSMRVVDLDDLPPPSRAFLRSKYPEVEGSIEIPEDAAKALALLFDAQALCLDETEFGDPEA